MRLLELFSGTDSIGREFPGEVVSLDITGTPTHRIDILQWDYTMYPPGHFDMIWASPPCTEYSSARRPNASTPRDLEGADQLVYQTIQIIQYFKPVFWFLENPWSGLLRRRSVVSALPAPIKVSYCRYGTPYRKDTASWTNTPIKFEFCQGNCNATVVGESGRKRHMGTALRGKSKYGTHGVQPQNAPLDTAPSMPPYLSLCRQLHKWRESGRYSRSSTSQGRRG